MSRWTLVFLVIVLVAALFGFGLVANMSYTATILFFIILVLAVLSLLGAALRQAPPL